MCIYICVCMYIMHFPSSYSVARQEDCLTFCPSFFIGPLFGFLHDCDLDLIIQSASAKPCCVLALCIQPAFPLCLGQSIKLYILKDYT